MRYSIGNIKFWTFDRRTLREVKVEIWFLIDANVKMFHFSCIFEKIVGNVSIENFVSTFTSQIFRHDTTWSFNFQTHYRIWNHYMEFMNKKYFELCEYYRKKKEKIRNCVCFFPAVLDTNGKMTTFFVLPILQKLKPEEFFSS